MSRLKKLIAVMLICTASFLSVGSGKGVVQALGVFIVLARVAVELAVLIASVSHDTDMRPAPESPHVICRVPAHTKVKIKARTPDSRWVKVELPDGRVGWISTKQLPIPKGKSVPVDKIEARKALKAATLRARIRARQS
jgi:hypothetical protein